MFKSRLTDQQFSPLCSTQLGKYDRQHLGLRLRGRIDIFEEINGIGRILKAEKYIKNSDADDVWEITRFHNLFFLSGSYYTHNFQFQFGVFCLLFFSKHD